MTAGDWGGYSCWHRLFDEVCNRRGHFDNQALAAEMCRLSGRSSKEDFDAAKKKLRQWRAGKRLPLRRNLAAVSQALAVQDDPELKHNWERLYSVAQFRQRPVDHQHEPLSAASAPDTGSRKINRWDILAAVSVLGISASVVAAAFERSAMQEVGYAAHVRMPVGDTRLVHGEHGSCDGSPPTWEALVPDLPESTLGIFSDGGLAAKMVNVCGKEMTVRAIRFTATSAGMEDVTLLQDPMRFEVLQTYEILPLDLTDEKGRQ